MTTSPSAGIVPAASHAHTGCALGLIIWRNRERIRREHGGAALLVLLAWVAWTTAGHTKRLTTNAIVMIGYAVGNSAGPQYWEKNLPTFPAAEPRALADPLDLLGGVRAAAARNARVPRAGHDARYDDVYVSEKRADGTAVDKKVDTAFLDLTDMQNQDFRYVL
ncbi:hypothetical protein C2E23DRAFT_892216 [Lenzites betulinus]|nr:hypothetical protein C2E23DRAFT_892216 [Lenzites betulinus]